MKRFSLSDIYRADCVISADARSGKIFHFVPNSGGGGRLTPIALYFAWKPEFVEGYNSHWRVDCFVRKHKLSPEPMNLGELLVAALIREQLCAEPIWLSVHLSQELKGKEYGDVFNFD